MVTFTTHPQQCGGVERLHPNVGTSNFRQMVEKVCPQGKAKFETVNRAKDGRLIPVERKRGASTVLTANLLFAPSIPRQSQ